jgi:ABC-type Zn uptake system ZnuABC Zn-binding protein ZnuA
MRSRFSTFLTLFLLMANTLSACSTGPAVSAPSGPRVLAAESFLADIAQNIAGDHLTIDTLIPLGSDPHAYELTPRDAARLSDADLLLINGSGFESWLAPALNTLPGTVTVVEAARGLPFAAARPGDPHFWLDPISAIQYVNNIRDALIKLDPQNKADYAANASQYTQKLQDLDAWVRQQVAVIPAPERLLLTNHESLGYYADRYGFTVIGTILESASTGAAPSAEHLAKLVDLIRASRAKAIFLETGANPELAQTLAAETGIRVVTDLQTHSITPPGGVAPTYLKMIEWNTLTIVKALQP